MRVDRNWMLERLDELRCTLRPQSGILRQAHRDQRLDIAGHIGPQRSQRPWYGSDVRRDELMRRQIMKRWLAGEQLVGQAAERIDVRAMIGRRIANRLLGR